MKKRKKRAILNVFFVFFVFCYKNMAVSFVVDILRGKKKKPLVNVINERSVNQTKKCL